MEEAATDTGRDENRALRTKSRRCAKPDPSVRALCRSPTLWAVRRWSAVRTLCRKPLLCPNVSRTPVGKTSTAVRTQNLGSETRYIRWRCGFRVRRGATLPFARRKKNLVCTPPRAHGRRHGRETSCRSCVDCISEAHVGPNHAAAASSTRRCNAEPCAGECRALRRRRRMWNWVGPRTKGVGFR